MGTRAPCESLVGEETEDSTLRQTLKYSLCDHTMDARCVDLPDVGGWHTSGRPSWKCWNTGPLPRRVRGPRGTLEGASPQPDTGTPEERHCCLWLPGGKAPWLHCERQSRTSWCHQNGWNEVTVTACHPWG
jgi:hypothetical protein